MTEIQVLMAVSDFFGFFSSNHFIEGGFTFQWGASFISWGKGKWGWASTLMQRLSKKFMR